MVMFLEILLSLLIFMLYAFLVAVIPAYLGRNAGFLALKILSPQTQPRFKIPSWGAWIMFTVGLVSLIPTILLFNALEWSISVPTPGWLPFDKLFEGMGLYYLSQEIIIVVIIPIFLVSFVAIILFGKFRKLK